MPPLDGDTLLGLAANAERVELRRASVLMLAIQAAFSDKPPVEILRAACDSDEDAEALANLIAARTELDRQGAATLQEAV